MFGGSQRSILIPLLFDIFLDDLFFIFSDTNIVNFTDKNRPYISGKNGVDVLKSLEQASLSLSK